MSGRPWLPRVVLEQAGTCRACGEPSDNHTTAERRDCGVMLEELERSAKGDACPLHARCSLVPGHVGGCDPRSVGARYAARMRLFRDGLDGEPLELACEAGACRAMAAALFQEGRA